MTSLSDRRTAVALIQEAHSHGARLKPACGLLGLTLRTYQRWVQTGGITADKRPMAVRPEPQNKLSEEEREAILAVCNSEPYRSAAPAFIVSKQAQK